LIRIKKHLKVAWELLERQGWKPFGSHAAMEKFPHLQLVIKFDEVGDPYFERCVIVVAEFAVILKFLQLKTQRNLACSL